MDKSLIIQELINSNAQITLLPRPRRFGKTLNLSMFRYFFENRKDNQELFRGLKILLQSLIDGDIELFEELFSEFVLETLSFYDVNRKNEEAVYHAFLLGILINLTDYEVISSKEAGLGRVDIILLHKEGAGHKYTV